MPESMSDTLSEPLACSDAAGVLTHVSPIRPKDYTINMFLC